MSGGDCAPDVISLAGASGLLWGIPRSRFCCPQRRRNAGAILLPQAFRVTRTVDVRCSRWTRPGSSRKFLF